MKNKVLLFLLLLNKILCGYSVEPPLRRGTLDVYPRHMFKSRNGVDHCQLKFYYVSSVAINPVIGVFGPTQTMLYNHRINFEIYKVEGL